MILSYSKRGKMILRFYFLLKTIYGFISRYTKVIYQEPQDRSWMRFDSIFFLNNKNQVDN